MTKLTREQRAEIAAEMTRLLATDDVTPLTVIYRLAVKHLESKWNPTPPPKK